MRIAQQILVVVSDGSHTGEIGKEDATPTPGVNYRITRHADMYRNSLSWCRNPEIRFIS